MKKRDAWADFVRRLPTAASADASFAALKRAYKTPPRAYHTFDHALWCVTEFEGLRAETDHALEIEGALWYHDAVYDPQGTDNEGASARFADEHLAAMGLPVAFRAFVGRLIRATTHRELPADGDEAIVQDVDLAILGRSRAEFDAYEAAIRVEYAFVAEPEYRRGRAAILRAFLGRDRIYRTDMLHERYEVAARANIERSLAFLERP